MLDTYPVFDSHLHIINKDFPLIENNNYLPDEFTVDEYQNRTSMYKVIGGAIVSGSFQGFDQTYLIDALTKLGNSFVGVTQIPLNTSDEEILKLNNYGVKAIRFNLKRGGSENLRHLSSMANRVYEICGWHTELYIDSSELPQLLKTIEHLPKISIDHLGLKKIGLKNIIKLADKGVRVKATGFGRVDFNVKDALKDIYSANPNSLMFGTDLPSTRASSVFTDKDFQLISDTFGNDALEKIFYQNAMDFYKKISD